MPVTLYPNILSLPVPQGVRLIDGEPQPPYSFRHCACGSMYRYTVDFTHFYLVIERCR